MLGPVLGVSFLVMVVAVAIGLVKSAYSSPATTKSFTDKLNDYRQTKLKFERSYVTEDEFWMSGASIVRFIQRFTDDEIKVSGFSAYLFFNSLYEIAINIRENNDFINPEYITEINKILEAVNKIVDNPDSRSLLSSNDREVRKIFWKLFLRIDNIHRRIKKDSEKRENQKASAGRSAALEIVSRLDEEIESKDSDLVFGQSGTGKTIPEYSSNTDSSVVFANKDALNMQDNNSDDLEDDDVWSFRGSAER